jgi:serine protease Do
MNRKTTQLQIATIFSSVILAGTMLSGCAASNLTATSPAPTPSSTADVIPPAITEESGVLASLEGSLENIYTQVDPSVVHIHVVQETMTSSLFGFPMGSQQQEGTGSGFIWDRDGHIVTNNHVVQDTQEIEVTFSDGAIVPAQVVGADPDSDLAVIQVDRPSEALPPVTMASPDDVTVGQLAVAIGNPFGLQGSMTLGIVSALGRSLPVENSSSQSANYTIPGIIQTDAPINPGNSGGVLVNDKGEVIGVTSAIISPIDASAGIGFAIPSAIVEKVIPALIETGRYQHPYLGISGMTLIPELVDAMQLPEGQLGALVIDVTPNGPADSAGLQGSDSTVTIDNQEYPIGGDVITAIDSHPVKSFDDIVSYLALNTEVNQTVALSIIRDGETITLQVTLQARPTETPQIAQQFTLSGAYLGIQGASLTPEIAQAAKLPESQQGVLIEQVVVGSPADQAGLIGGDETVVIGGQDILIGGDVILAIDNITVATMEDLQALLGQMLPDQQASLSILRAGKTIQVEITLGQPPS